MEYLNKLMLMKAGFSNIEIPSDISCQKDCPTYLRKFIGNNQIDFIYKHIDVEEDLSITVDTLDFNHTSESLDGNPLKLELADESFNDVMVEYKSAAKVQLWHKSEAKHGFMLRKDSILIMNNFLSKWNNQNDYQWIWFLVDAKDYILFGSRHLNGWWFNARVKPMPSVLYNDINLNVLLENYIKQHKLEYNDVTVNVSVEYDLRSNDIETFDEENLSVPPPMKLLAYWNELSLTIPLSGKTILRQDLSVGSESKSKHLWNELCIVQELYDLIKKHQNTSSDMIYKIIMPSSSDPDLYVPVEEKLQEMLHQDHDYDIEPAEEIQSFNRIVFNGRLHLSFCDKIWTILKDVSCYSQLVKCFNIIFSTIAHGKVNIQTEENTNTRLESLVYDVFHHRAAIPHLSGLQPLELLLEAGVEKLCKDYIYFFETYKLYHNKLPFYEIPKETSSNIAYSMMKPRLTIHPNQAKQKVFNSSIDAIVFENSRFDEKEYTHKFKILARVHVVLEALINIEKPSKSEMSNLLEMCSSLMETVLNEKDPDYKPPQSLKDLQKNVEQTINVPLQTKYAKSIIRNPNDPESVHVKFSTERSTRKITTQYSFNISSMFPPHLVQTKNLDHPETDSKSQLYNVAAFFNVGTPV